MSTGLTETDVVAQSSGLAFRDASGSFGLFAGYGMDRRIFGEKVLKDVPNAALISVGSDGTDGPTDAAGGYTDTDTVSELCAKDMDIKAYLANNDAYHALGAVDGLIFTGPTGTNVNDLTVGLILQ